MHSSFQNRCIVLCSILVVGLSVLSARLVQIQLVDRRYTERAQRERHTTAILRASRGMIVDRHEEPLAKSIPISTVLLDRKILMDPTQASRGLAYQEASEEPGWNELDPVKQSRRINLLRGEILARESPESIVQKHLAYAVGILARPMGMRREELREKIENTKGDWFPIAKDLPQDVGDQLDDMINKQRIQGFVIEGSIKRWYTVRDRAAHLIGFTGESPENDAEGRARIVGQFGVEASMEPYLAGRDGWREHYRDARGEVVPGPSTGLKPPRAGLNVKLTIDMGIQSILEEELDAGLTEYCSKQGTAILMDPKTGEVLAMASRPNFDLNLREGLGKDGNGAGVNYAIQTIYEPGSTIKVVAASGALNEGLVTPLTSIYCHNGFYQGKGFVVTDEHPASSLSVEGVLAKSNNNGAYSLGRQLGSKRFYGYLRDFGFGRKTGIQLSGENSGTARNTGKEVDFSRACYGYATNVTPLQLACAYSAIASDGKLRKPHIIKSLIANDGTVVEDYAPEVVNEVLKPKVAMQMRVALEKVVKSGTATRAAVSGFLVGGKTGTVKKYNPNTRNYYDHKKIASFAGMMPVQDPAFVCVVVIDDSQHPTIKAQGGLVAAPIFSKIATRVAAHMNLQPTEPISTPPVTAAR